MTASFAVLQHASVILQLEIKLKIRKPSFCCLPNLEAESRFKDQLFFSSIGIVLIAEKIVESDQEFEENMNLIEMQANTQSQETIQGQTQLQAPNAPENIVIAPKKRGRKKKETLPKALEKSPDVAKTQNLRRSQRSKK